jgi:hypothetical protein
VGEDELLGEREVEFEDHRPMSPGSARAVKGKATSSAALVGDLAGRDGVALRERLAPRVATATRRSSSEAITSCPRWTTWVRSLPNNEESRERWNEINLGQLTS